MIPAPSNPDPIATVVALDLDGYPQVDNTVLAIKPQSDGSLALTAANAGVISFTRSFAAQLGPHGIQVNAVAPGPIDTALLKNAQPERIEALMRQVYSKRPGKPEEVADLILFLCSSASRYIHGQTIEINGGMFMI